ncbi:MAG: nucleoside recognition domain-containing protein [Acutalibacteraceae bacterium]
MMNYVFPILLVLSFAAAAVQGRMGELSAAVIQSGQDAVSLLLRLASMLCLWGGVMEIAEKSGITRMMAKLLSPLLKLIFPSLRKEKYAMEAISMNVTANILGLGNAATPLGLEAMRRLQEINGEKSTASDEMIVFVVMNTAAMHIIPTTVATLRGQYGSADPMEIMPASILTSVCALTIAVVVAKLGNVLYRRLRRREAKGGRRLSAVGSKGL